MMDETSSKFLLLAKNIVIYIVNISLFCQTLITFLDLCISQIAIAIGVLTSNRGEGDEPLWRIGRGTRVPLQGAVDVVPLLGAIVGCHC